MEPATRWFDQSFAPIPKFDDRFARQNRFEPPPEFPLASPYSGIVHHLSGPNIYALTQIFLQRIMTGRWCTLRIPSITFIAQQGFTPAYSHTCQTPWSVFQDGRDKTISSISCCNRAEAKVAIYLSLTHSRCHWTDRSQLPNTLILRIKLILTRSTTQSKRGKPNSKYIAPHHLF